MAGYEMTAEEQARYERDGYLVRASVFDAAECAAIAAECEALCESVSAQAGRAKLAVGSYMFERQAELATFIKWEPDQPDLVQGIEPFAHLSDSLAARGADPRLTDPCKAIVGEAEVAPYTEKLNLKRARRGGKYVLHQDYPYWRKDNPEAARMATAMIFLDDSTVANGCLQVAPGSHREGVAAPRGAEGFAGLEMDPAKFDERRLVPLEVTAGSIAFFGALLVHKSLPNTSDDDRRALLYSYQPGGMRHVTEIARENAAAERQWTEGRVT